MKTKFIIKVAVIAALTSASLVSCMDTPQSIAWSYYCCAKDTLEAGDPYAAQDYLKCVTPGRDSTLDCKTDSLRLVIEKAIKEDKSKATNDSI